MLFPPPRLVAVILCGRTGDLSSVYVIRVSYTPEGLFDKSITTYFTEEKLGIYSVKRWFFFRLNPVF